MDAGRCHVRGFLTETYSSCRLKRGRGSQACRCALGRPPTARGLNKRHDHPNRLRSKPVFAVIPDGQSTLSPCGAPDRTAECRGVVCSRRMRGERQSPLSGRRCPTSRRRSLQRTSVTPIAPCGSRNPEMRCRRSGLGPGSRPSALDHVSGSSWSSLFSTNPGSPRCVVGCSPDGPVCVFCCPHRRASRHSAPPAGEYPQSPGPFGCWSTESAVASNDLHGTVRYL